MFEYSLPTVRCLACSVCVLMLALVPAPASAQLQIKNEDVTHQVRYPGTVLGRLDAGCHRRFRRHRRAMRRTSICCARA